MSESFKNLEISEQAHRQELLKFKEQTLEQSKNCFATYKASMRSLLSRCMASSQGSAFIDFTDADTMHHDLPMVKINNT